MCGVIGFFHPNGRIDMAGLQAATRALAHRGPDGEGVWHDVKQQAGLGHRRLALLDTDGGQQPIISEDGMVAVSVNGEIYGDAGLRAELEQQGCRFATRSDSELILHLYRRYGLDFVHYLRGEFAFILYDAGMERMIAVRDRFGIKPLCYHRSASGLLRVASEAKALLAAGVVAAWNEPALARALGWQYPGGSETYFKEIHLLPPGHMLIHDHAGLKVKRYWELEFPEASTEHDIPDAVERVRALLDDAIAVRLRRDSGALCCHLSGGMDSSAIAARASHHEGRPLPCFTVTFPHTAYDEGSDARAFARSLGAEWHEVPTDAARMADALSEAVAMSEGLAINGHLPAKYLLNKAIRAAGFKIVLSGEGADELFAGYAHLMADAGTSSDPPGMVAGIHVPTQPVTLPSIQKALGFTPSFLQAKSAAGRQLQAWLRPEFVARLPGDDFLKRFSDSIRTEQLAAWSPVNISTYLWSKSALATYILRVLGDGCEMAHGVEGRVPFLDHLLFGYTASIPPLQKIQAGVEKQLLRRAVAPWIGEKAAAKRKHPFIAPPFSVTRDRTASQFIQDHVNSRSFAASPFFDSAKMQRFLDTLPDKTEAEQAAAEPAIMLTLTAHLLGAHYGL